MVEIGLVRLKYLKKLRNKCVYEKLACKNAPCVENSGVKVRY